MTAKNEHLTCVLALLTPSLLALACLQAFSCEGLNCSTRIRPEFTERAAAYWQECTRLSHGMFESTCYVQVKALYGFEECGAGK
jgi:hypothetical protein